MDRDEVWGCDRKNSWLCELRIWGRFVGWGLIMVLVIGDVVKDVVVVLVGMWVGVVMWLIRKPERKKLRETNGQSSISFFQMPIYRMRKWET